MIDRQNLPGVFRTFDFANPDITTAQRYATTVPQQALFMLNSPFVVQQVRAVVARAEAGAGASAGVGASEAERVRQLYRIVLQRDPTAEETREGLEFLRASAAEVPAITGASGPVWRYGFGGYDVATQRVAGFTALKHQGKTQFQAGAEFPDPKLGYVSLTAMGGHPGRDAQHAAIRRWTSPVDGFVSIAGTLKHSSENGDGVRGRIVSSRKGLLGEWGVKNKSADTAVAEVEVRTGDTLDFVTDPLASPDHDSFAWAPTLKVVRGAVGAMRDERWSAAKDFVTTPAAPAQALPPWGSWRRCCCCRTSLRLLIDAGAGRRGRGRLQASPSWQGNWGQGNGEGRIGGGLSVRLRSFPQSRLNGRDSARPFQHHSHGPPAGLEIRVGLAQQAGQGITDDHIGGGDFEHGDPVVQGETEFHQRQRQPGRAQLLDPAEGPVFRG